MEIIRILLLALSGFITFTITAQTPLTPIPNLNQIPIADRNITAAPMAFAKNRPTVVVLISGVTGFPTRDNHIGTLKGARNYWGYDFVFDFLGSTTDRPTTFTNDDPVSGTIAKFQWETRFINSDQPTDHFLTIYGRPKLDANTPFYTPFSLMMTYRDGSLSYKKQVVNTASQIVTLYNSVFREWPEEKKPQLILLCHSFGGVIARTICSKPNSVPSNNPLLVVETFTDAEKRDMEFIRNKTVHITTLSTPHEGSPITWNAALGTLLQHVPWFFGPQIDDSDPDTYILKQLAVSYMDNINKTILRPELCKRSDGTLIPIHTLGGRVPAGPEFFADPNVNDNNLTTIDGGIGSANVTSLERDQSNRNKFECYNLVRVDYAMHLFFGGPTFRPWGATPSTNTDLDIIKITDVQPVLGCLTPPIYNALSFAASPRLFYQRNSWSNIEGELFGVKGGCTFKFSSNANTAVSDGEIDSDGFVPINSSLGVNLGTPNKNYFDHSVNWAAAGGSPGSWYRFYKSKADFHNHGTIKFSGEIGQWLRENIIGNTPTALLFGTLDRFKSAGPKTGANGTVSAW